MKALGTHEALVENLMKLIEKGDLSTAYCLVTDLHGVNISEPERRAKLPKTFHQVASSCLTTPMRMCISWRRLQLLEDLLESQCIISQNDKNLGLQKILSYTRRQLGKEELQIIVILIKHGARINVTHLANVLHLAFGRSEDIYHSLMDVIIKDANNEQKGSLLLALYLRDRNLNQNKVSIQTTSYNVCQGDIRRLVQALPHLLQLSTTVDNWTVALILRQIVAHFPLINMESTPILKLLSKLLVHLGYDICLVNSVARCSARFNKVFGFSRAAEHTRMTTLQESCRFSIRGSIRESNVLLGVQQLCLPESMRRYILLQHIFDFEKHLTPCMA